MAGPRRRRRNPQQFGTQQWASRLAIRTGVLTTLFLACVYAIGAALGATRDEDTQVAQDNPSAFSPFLVFVVVGVAAVVVALLVAHVLIALPAARHHPQSPALVFAYVAAAIVGVLALIGFAIGPGLLLSVPAAGLLGGGTFVIARQVAKRMPPFPQGLSVRRTDAGDRPLGGD